MRKSVSFIGAKVPKKCHFPREKSGCHKFSQSAQKMPFFRKMPFHFFACHMVFQTARFVKNGTLGNPAPIPGLPDGNLAGLPVEKIQNQKWPRNGQIEILKWPRKGQI